VDFSYVLKLINRGVVQGSGLGPTLCIVMKSDTKPVFGIDILFMYADDTNFLVSENTDVGVYDEFYNIPKWAADNQMIVYLGKTLEIVFHRPSARCTSPHFVTGILCHLALSQYIVCHILRKSTNIYKNYSKIKKDEHFFGRWCCSALRLISVLYMCRCIYSALCPKIVVLCSMRSTEG